MSEKILIVTPYEPAAWGVGPIILQDLIQQHAAGTFAMCLVGHGRYEPSEPTGCGALSWIRLVPPRLHRADKTSRIAAFAMLTQTIRALPRARRLARQVLRYAGERRVGKVAVILSRPSTVLLARYLADLTPLPLYPLVWDDPRYVMRQGGMDSFSRRIGMMGISRCMSRARHIAVVSDPMKEKYETDYGTPCIIARYGVARRGAGAPAAISNPPNPITVGFAGSQYAPRAWSAFTAALDSLGWQIGGRPVVLRVLGNSVSLRTSSPARIELLGWRNGEETLRLLRECDLLYLSYPFDASMRECAQLSFPAKLSTYAATGRPVFVHTPPYGSLVPFFDKYPGGAVCTSLEKGDVSRTLCDFLLDRERYLQASRDVVKMVDQELSVEAFHEQYARFLDLDT